MNVKNKFNSKIDSLGPRESAIFGSLAGMAIGYILARPAKVKK